MTTYRVTETEVNQILPAPQAPGSLIPYIASANSLVTELCHYAADRMALIELWLSAHFWRCGSDNQQAQSETIGKASITFAFANVLAQGIRSTTFGQQAIRLDTAGALANMDVMMERGLQKRKLGMLSLGPNCRQPNTGSQPFTDVQ